MPNFWDNLDEVVLEGSVLLSRLLSQYSLSLELLASNCPCHWKKTSEHGANIPTLRKKGGKDRGEGGWEKREGKERLNKT